MRSSASSPDCSWVRLLIIQEWGLIRTNEFRKFTMHLAGKTKPLSKNHWCCERPQQKASQGRFQQESNNCSIWPRNRSSVSWCFVIQLSYSHIFCHLLSLVLCPDHYWKVEKGSGNMLHCHFHKEFSQSCNHVLMHGLHWRCMQHNGLCDRPECIHKTCFSPLKPNSDKLLA